MIKNFTKINKYLSIGILIVSFLAGLKAFITSGYYNAFFTFSFALIILSVLKLIIIFFIKPKKNKD